MNNQQRSVMKCYLLFFNLWVKEYGYNDKTFFYKLGYNYLIFYTERKELSWVILEELKLITDRNNTSWYVMYNENGLIIKFQK